MRSRFLPTRVCALLLILGACGQGTGVLIGDAYPRAEGTPGFLNAIRPAVESAGVRIEPWSLGGDRRETIQLNSEQATLFANVQAVAGVVGHSGSRDALLGAAVYNRRGVPHVVPNATSRRLGKSGPWTFPLVPDDSVEGDFIARFALDSLNARRVVVLYLGDEYGIGLRDGVRAGLKQRGSDLTDAALVPSQACGTPIDTEVNRAIAIASLRRSKPDVIVMAAGVDGSWCLTDLVHTVDPSVWVLGGDGMDGARAVPAEFTNVNPQRVRGVLFWSAGTDSLNTAFVSLVRGALGRNPNASEALQFDGFMLLAAAVREVGGDRRAIRTWLASLGSSRPAWIGVTGPIAFNQPRSSILRMSAPGSSTQ